MTLSLNGQTTAGLRSDVTVVADVVRRFRLDSLYPAVAACEALVGAAPPLDVAVLGQFKSGKSSLLNAVLGEPVFPVGAVPVTAVITRAIAGPKRVVRVMYQEGSAEEVAPSRLAEFVTEAGNPENRRRVAVVDAVTPAMDAWPGLRLVDTPGLGSVFVHNSQATRAWMPNVVVALVAVSAERPLSDEDRRLIAEARETAPRVAVVLTKVDLLTDAELAEVTVYVDTALRAGFGAVIPVLPFSVRAEPERWLRRLRVDVLQPVVGDVAGERRTALRLKLATLASACLSYLTVGLRAAEVADADRDRLRSAVLNESVNAAIIRDELRLAEEAARDQTRPAFEKAVLDRHGNVVRRVTEALGVEAPTWRGNLAWQGHHFQEWLAARLAAELTPISADIAPLANDLLGRAEERLRRMVEAFRDRLSRNIHAATGITVSPAPWEAERAQVDVVPVAVGRTFMLSWDMLAWLLPMSLFGGLFRRHIRGRVPWEVEKNLTRLAGDWAEAVNAAVTDLRGQAARWVEGERLTLERLLGQRPAEAEAFRAAIRELEQMGKNEGLVTTDSHCKKNL